MDASRATARERASTAPHAASQLNGRKRKHSPHNNGNLCGALLPSLSRPERHACWFSLVCHWSAPTGAKKADEKGAQTESEKRTRLLFWLPLLLSRAHFQTSCAGEQRHARRRMAACGAPAAASPNAGDAGEETAGAEESEGFRKAWKPARDPLLCRFLRRCALFR